MRIRIVQNHYEIYHYYYHFFFHFQIMSVQCFESSLEQSLLEFWFYKMKIVCVIAYRSFRKCVVNDEFFSCVFTENNERVTMIDVSPIVNVNIGLILLLERNCNNKRNKPRTGVRFDHKTLFPLYVHIETTNIFVFDDSKFVRNPANGNR